MFWPFPLYRLYQTSWMIDEIFRKFIESDDVILTTCGEYMITLKSELHGTLEFWNANKPYAWASRGTYTTPLGKMVSWNKDMPSRWTLRQLNEKLKELPYDKPEMEPTQNETGN